MNYGHGYGRGRRTKYGANRVKINGQVFDSQKEADRYAELKLMERAGIIYGLERQVVFELTPTVREPDTIGPKGGRKPGKVILSSAKYKADFTYYMGDEFIVEDVKGVRTKEYILKKKVLYHLRGLLIHEV